MGINFMSLVLFAALNILAIQLNKCRRSVLKLTLGALLAVLFAGNLFRYLYAYPRLVGEVHIPIEYSTVAYFLVPVFMLVNRRRSRVWASIYGLTAGLLYYLTMILAANRLYADAPYYDVYISLFCHGTLYLNGVICLSRERITTRDVAKTMLCLLIVSIRALLLRKYAIDADELFIYDIMFGNVIRMVTPESTWFIMVPVYYIALNAVIIRCLKGFFPHKQDKKPQKAPDADDSGDSGASDGPA